MSGAGTKDTDLIRVIVDRCDVDLGDICTEYANEYNKPLKDVVAVTNIQKFCSKILFQFLLKFAEWDIRLLQKSFTCYDWIDYNEINTVLMHNIVLDTEKDVDSKY